MNQTNTSPSKYSGKTKLAYCLSIGRANDPDSLVAYPSMANRCHHCHPLAIPTFEHQGAVCLTEKYLECGVFLNSKGGKFPSEIEHPENAAHNKLRRITSSSYRLWFGAFIGFLTVLLVILAGIFAFKPAAAVPAIIQSNTQPAVSPSATVSPTVTIQVTLPLPLPSPVPSKTLVPKKVVPTKTATLTPAVFFGLDTTLGTDKKFIIHRVLAKQNLELLANRYNTTQQAILAITYELFTPVWVGKLVIIPVDQKDVSGLPVLQPYKITQAGITLTELAKTLGVNVDDLERFNGCGLCRFKAGSWILIIPKS